MKFWSPTPLEIGLSVAVNGGGFLSLRIAYKLSLSLLLRLELFKKVVVVVGVETYFSVQLKSRPS